jgi:hypothetical protein
LDISKERRRGSKREVNALLRSSDEASYAYKGVNLPRSVPNGRPGPDPFL